MIFDRLRRWWLRAHRGSFTSRKISRAILTRWVNRWATDERTLVIHPEFALDLFPNRVVVSKRAEDQPDILVDTQFHELSRIESGSFPMILCIGLLEHLKDPQRFVDELRRILAPGGRAVVKGSSVFAFHEGPENYFHFTPYGMRELFRDWSRIEALDCVPTGPFTSIAILLQRVHLQCDISPPLRPLMEIAFHALPLLDRFVKRQYDNINRLEEQRVTAVAPAAVMLAAVK